MSRHNLAAQRLFVEVKLEEGARIAPSKDQLNYLLNVLRLGEGEEILLFNGADGEWRARLVEVARRSASLAAMERIRAQEPAPDLHYAFSPLKQARLDYMAQKAVEMGASRLIPVLTRRTQVRRVNRTRLRANAIEAAEQCGILIAPNVDEEVELSSFLSNLPPERLLVFCDEDAEPSEPIGLLRSASAHKGVTLLIGPEGGFEDGERAAILRSKNALRLSLGPRVLRADTAAVAALALIQAAFWRE